MTRIEAVPEGKVEGMVVRYGGLVYGAALRQMKDAAAAEDVAQAVFLVALRRKESLPEDGRMAGWLLKVTHYAVKAAKRSAARRAFHERQAAGGRNEAGAADSGEDLRPWLDAGLLALGRIDREVVVRRYLQGERVDEIAQRVGLSENAASKRLGRALEKLQEWFRRRGLSAPPAVVAGMMMKESAVQPPGPVQAMLAGTTPRVSALLAREVLWRKVMAKLRHPNFMYSMCASFPERPLQTVQCPFRFGESKGMGPRI